MIIPLEQTTNNKQDTITCNREVMLSILNHLKEENLPCEMELIRSLLPYHKEKVQNELLSKWDNDEESKEIEIKGIKKTKRGKYLICL